MAIFMMAFKNVRAYWKHSLAAIFAIASGVLSINLFQGYVDDLSTLFHESLSKVRMLGDLVIEDKNLRTIKGKANPHFYEINKEDQGKWESFFDRHPELVSERVRFLNISGQVTNGYKSAIFIGIGHDLARGAHLRGKRFAYNTYFGRPLHEFKNQSMSEEGRFVAGGNLAKLLDCQFDNNQKFNSNKDTWLIEKERPFDCKTNLMQLSATTVHDQMNAINMNLVGIIDGSYKEIDAKLVHMDIRSAQILLDTSGISYMGVQLRSPGLIKKFQHVLVKELGEAFVTKFTILPWEKHEFGEIYVKNMDLFALFRNFVLTVIVFVCGLSVFNTMLKTVMERLREIGTLRSLGFSKGQIQQLFLAEGFILSSVGVFLGGGFSLFLAFIFKEIGLVYKAGLLTRPAPFGIDISLTLFLSSALVMILLSLLATFFALKSVVSKKIIECLSHV